jgi:hypothetical protein
VATGDAEQDTEQGEDEVVFIIQKKMWLTSTSFSVTE